MYQSTHSLTFALDGHEWSASRSSRFTYVNSLRCVFRWMCIVTLSRTFALDGSEWSASRSSRFTYVNSLRCVFRWMCIVTLSRSGNFWKRKNLCPRSGIRTPDGRACSRVTAPIIVNLYFFLGHIFQTITHQPCYC